MSIVPNIILDRNTPTNWVHLELNALYRITGQGEGVDMLPVQIFRYEKEWMAESSGTQLAVGTLWWKVWVGGRWFSGVQKDHALAAHHISVGRGSKLSSRHDFHLEKISPKDVKTLLGDGRIYADYMQNSKQKAVS